MEGRCSARLRSTPSGCSIATSSVSGLKPSRSRRGFGTTIRPALSILSSIPLTIPHAIKNGNKQHQTPFGSALTPTPTPSQTAEPSDAPCIYFQMDVILYLRRFGLSPFHTDGNTHVHHNIQPQGRRRQDDDGRARR